MKRESRPVAGSFAFDEAIPSNFGLGELAPQLGEGEFAHSRLARPGRADDDYFGQRLGVDGGHADLCSQPPELEEHLPGPGNFARFTRRR